MNTSLALSSPLQVGASLRLGGITAQPVGRVTIDWETTPLDADVDRARLVKQILDGRTIPVHHSDARGWFIFDGTRWIADHTARTGVLGAIYAVGDLIRAQAEHAMAGGNRDEGQRMARSASAFLSQPGAERVLKALENLPDVTIDAAKFDSDPDLLGVANGFVDLRDGYVCSGTPSAKITRHISTYAGVGETPTRWLQFLEEVFPDPEIREWMHSAIGYAATGHNREHIFLMFVGKGSNGKSVLLDTLSHVLDGVTETAMPELLGSRKVSNGAASPEVAMLQGARLALTSETDSRMVLNGTLIKRMTGDDSITARWLNANPVTFKPTALPIMATNFKPRVYDAGDGMWRRIIVVPFDATFTGKAKDHGLLDELRGESEGILDWIIEGAIKWNKHKLPELPKRMAAEVATYRDMSDRLGEFLMVNVKESDDEGRLVKASEMFSRFKLWCEVEGHEPPMKRQEFDTQLRDRLTPYVGTGRDKGTKFWRGVELISEHSALNPITATTLSPAVGLVAQ